MHRIGAEPFLFFKKKNDFLIEIAVETKVLAFFFKETDRFGFGSIAIGYSNLIRIRSDLDSDQNITIRSDSQIVKTQIRFGSDFGFESDSNRIGFFADP